MAGAVPRVVGTNVQANDALDTQEQGLPRIAVRRCEVSGLACAVATSAIHNVIASSLVTVKAIFCPSADHDTFSMLLPAGIDASILRAAPPLTACNDRPV